MDGNPGGTGPENADRPGGETAAVATSSCNNPAGPPATNPGVEHETQGRPPGRDRTSIRPLIPAATPRRHQVTGSNLRGHDSRPNCAPPFLRLPLDLGKNKCHYFARDERDRTFVLRR